MTSLINNVVTKRLALLLVAGLLVWAAGIPAWLATTDTEAAALTNFSDLLEDSDLSARSNHTITFTLPNSVPVGSYATATFASGFDLTSLTEDDVDIATGTDLATAATCDGTAQTAVTVSGQNLVFEICAESPGGIAASSTVTVEIGENAGFDGTGAADNRIINPGSAQSYVITVVTGPGASNTDAADTRVAIIDDVVVTASVDTSLTFTISGIGAGAQPNGDTSTSTIASTATALAFGTLASGTPAIMAQRLNLSTNATNGFSVTVKQNTNLQSSTGADIDLFDDGTASHTPRAWTAPLGILDAEQTYGHLGVTTEDNSLTFGDEFGVALYSGAIATSGREVFYHTGPSDGTTDHIGSTTVAYKIEITDLQEAGADYTNTLTYIATPVF